MYIISMYVCISLVVKFFSFFSRCFAILGQSRAYHLFQVLLVDGNAVDHALVPLTVGGRILLVGLDSKPFLDFLLDVINSDERNHNSDLLEKSEFVKLDAALVVS